MDPRLGAVGRITGSNPAVLDALSAAGFLPVVACVAGGPGGAVFNVNADQMAVACAVAWQVSKLLFLTDVDGVRDASGATVPVLSAGDARALIDQGVASGGMRAKLESALAALQAGIGEVLIAPGAAPDVLTRLLAGEPLGTRLVPEAQ
jgi:acetylglutamate kinase